MKKYAVVIMSRYELEATSPQNAIELAIAEDIETPARDYTVLEIDAEGDETEVYSE